MIRAKSAWLDGKLVPWETCHVHISSFGLHYGVGVFEGIRCYRREDGSSGVFRLPEHVQRLFDSAALCGIAMPFAPDDIVRACLEVLRENQLDEAYIRPLVFPGAGPLGLGATGHPTVVAIFAWPWQPPLASASAQGGVKAQVSAFVRGHPASGFSKAKITGGYAPSVLAKREAMRVGADEAILLDTHGLVAEGSAQNIFAVFDGVLYTPGKDAPILPGITRDAILALARHEGMDVVERSFSRDSLYLAEEVFFSGTAVELASVRQVDAHVIGKGVRGPVTLRLQQALGEAVRGKSMPWPQWITPV